MKAFVTGVVQNEWSNEYCWMQNALPASLHRSFYTTLLALFHAQSRKQINY